MAWVVKGAYWAVLPAKGTVPLNNRTKLSVESGAMAMPLRPRASELALKSRETHWENGFLGLESSFGKNKEGRRSRSMKKEADLSREAVWYNFSRVGSTGFPNLVRTMFSMSKRELPKTVSLSRDKRKTSLSPRVYFVISASWYFRVSTVLSASSPTWNAAPLPGTTITKP